VKYTRLTKEQLEELHQEFINFLATQTITADEWKTLKTEKPDVAEQELDVFSDLVWEGVLKQAAYLENISSQHMYLFHLGENEMKLIAVKILTEEIDITTKEGFAWLRENHSSDEVEILTANKTYSADRNVDKFALIQQGSSITKGQLFQWFQAMMA
jgi:cag pathogenicity island protein 24